MTDIKLNATTWDIEFDGVDIELVDLHEEIKQSVQVALKTGLGEWMYDTQAGTGYIGIIMSKNPHLPAIEAEFRRVINGVEGVKTIDNIELSLEKQTRVLTAYITVTSIYNRSLQIVV